MRVRRVALSYIPATSVSPRSSTRIPEGEVYKYAPLVFPKNAFGKAAIARLCFFFRIRVRFIQLEMRVGRVYRVPACRYIPATRVSAGRISASDHEVDPVTPENTSGK
jgi:hypothetical protein